jgi:NAD(P)-dependent dehydrogenase (short-subunit alcohol dehydrogenase family)
MSPEICALSMSAAGDLARARNRRAPIGRAAEKALKKTPGGKCMRFAGKTVMITGGAQGIGEAAAHAFAQEGAAIVIADLDKPRADAVIAALEGAGARGLAHACNVTDPQALADCVAAADARFGGIDVLINGAALHNFTYGKPTLALDLDKWRAMLEVNVLGIVNAVGAVRSSMARRGGGAVVNLSSSNSFDKLSAYGVSKLAVRGLTVAMAAELADENIRVVGVAPGMTDTDSTLGELPQVHQDMLINKMQLIKRQIRRADIVNTFLFLCSDQAAMITGDTLIVAGGYPVRI